MKFGTAFVTGYYPENGTVDLRTLDGVTFDKVPFVPSLAVYPAPIVAIIDSEGKISKPGSSAIYYQYTDNEIYVTSIFNDDHSIFNILNPDNLQSHAYIKNSLYRMIQEGELLLSSPGRFVEIAADVDNNLAYERLAGGWMLFKNSGDIYVSNADTSAQFLLANSGAIKISSVNYNISGATTTIKESDDGSLNIGSQHSSIAISDKLLLKVDDFYIELTKEDMSVAIPVFTISVSDRLDFITNTINISASKINISTTELLASIDETLELVTNTLNVTTAALNIALTSGLHFTLPNIDAEITPDDVTINLNSKVKINVSGIILTIENGTILIDSNDADITLKAGATPSGYLAVANTSGELLGNSGAPLPIVGLAKIKIE